MVRLSIMARATFSPARKVRSTTTPLRTPRSVVRTNAWPLPGLTCWNSMTWYKSSSSSRVIPFLRSFVVIIAMKVGSLGGSTVGWSCCQMVLGERVSRRKPDSVTTTVSSHRTPPTPAR